MRRHLLTAASVLTLAVSAGAAQAQKAQDTLRIAVAEPFSSVSGYFYTQRDSSPFYSSVYQTLVKYDERTSKIVPELAKSWTRVGDTVIEMELRDDVVFHGGNKFDADDIAHNLMWAADPKVKLPFKERYDWVKSVEKLGPAKVRIVTKDVFATDLLHLAYRLYIFDSKTFKTYANPEEFGQKTPYGSGPYKAVSVDRNRGTLVERFEQFSGAGAHYRSPIKRIHAVPVPDAQTQIARLLVGEVDAITNVAPDNAAALKKNPDLRVTPVDSVTVTFFLVDALGRSGRDELKDARVRKALMMAIDRDALIKNIIPGGEAAQKIQAMCVKSMIGCAHSVDPVGYDPAAARKLLAEAGYPDGFDIQMQAHSSVKDIAQAVSGDLRKIGVRASIEVMTIGVMRKKREGGEYQINLGYYPNALPDSSNAMSMYFGGNRDYAGDPVLREAIQVGESTHDAAKRNKAFKEAYDRINSEHYMLPISTLPAVYAHSKDVRIEPNRLSVTEVKIYDWHWN